MSVKEYIKSTKIYSAFDKTDISKKGLTNTIEKGILGGGVFLSAPIVADWYANSPNLRQLVTDYAPEFYKSHFSMRALQDVAVNTMGLAPGSFTDYLAVAGLATALYGGYKLKQKSDIRKEKIDDEETVEKFGPSDVVDVIKNNPIKTALTGVGIFGHAANLASYIMNDFTFVEPYDVTFVEPYNATNATVASTIVATKAKTKDYLSNLGKKFDAWYYHSNIL
ncbi:MAG: hypothetical protein WA139_03440 [Candidatus Aenigmatarchaeota archaeon]